jgi:hypothetical protein
MVMVLNYVKYDQSLRSIWSDGFDLPLLNKADGGEEVPPARLATLILYYDRLSELNMQGKMCCRMNFGWLKTI